MVNKKYTNKPVKVSTLLPNILKATKRKNGSILLEIKIHWKNIVGKEISDKCFVSNLQKINRKNILTIISSDANLLELSYSSEEIKNKINNFFIDNKIDDIKFKKSFQL